MDRAQKSRLETNYWYREGCKEGAWLFHNTAAMLIWGLFTGFTVPFALWFKWAPPMAWVLWTLPMWLSVAIWLFFKWLDWRYPVTK